MQKINDIRVLSECLYDLKEGQNFYNQSEKGVGDYFYDSIIADIHSLVLYAGIHPEVLGLYRMPARRFPYFIFYFIEENDVYVVATMPMRRHPDWIIKQLQQRKL
jgi:hypothetical protein